MEIIKTDCRSRLTDDSVSDLMIIKLDSPEVKDFEPQPAVDVWLQKKRMPYFNDNRSTSRRDKRMNLMIKIHLVKEESTGSCSWATELCFGLVDFKDH